MNQEQALLAAITENPDDDTPRLIYADYIEEQGRRDRAEFIRVQCELAAIGEHPGVKVKEIRFRRISTKGFSRVTKKCDCCWCLLKKRERELLETHRGQWCDLVPGFKIDAWSLDEPVIAYQYGARVLYRRGFIEFIIVSCQNWLDHGAEVLRACPTIREVRLNDCRPYAFAIGDNRRQVCGWLHGQNQYSPWYVQDPIWSHLQGNKHFFAGGVWVCYYEAEDAILTDDLAYADLWQACIAYARNQLAAQPIPT